MAPKKGAVKPKKVATGGSRDEEWVPSRTSAADLDKMVAAGVIPDRLTAGWRPASGEPFPTPHTDEAIVFEDYFWRGLGFPVHPFLRDLMEFWAVSLCNLHPNTILHVSIFIHFCEAFLGVLPHFNLFRHLFCLKKKGGSGSKVVGGMYLQLRDGMASEYINVPLNTSLKGWNSRWFYIKQSHPLIRCDVHYIPVNHSNWSERPNNAEMEQVMELLELSKGLELRGELIAASFIVRRIQPCKERAHPAFDYKGDNDGTRESTDRLSKKEVMDRAMDLFSSNVSFSWPKGTKAFNCTNLPP